MFKRIKNFLFCLKYPFWKARNVFSDAFLGYDFTLYDCISEGWKKAFGLQLSRDLKKALIKDKQLKTFRFSQIKEKWGELCLYNFGCGKETAKVLEYYEDLSKAFCQNCGEPVRYVSRKGWVTYLCEDCAADLIIKRENLEKEADFNKLLQILFDELDKMRLTTEDINTWKCSDVEMQKIHDSIDWKKLWRLE